MPEREDDFYGENPYSAPAGSAQMARPSNYEEYMRQRAAENRREFFTRAILPIVLSAGGGALLGSAGGGAGAAAGGGGAAAGGTLASSTLAPLAPYAAGVTASGTGIGAGAGIGAGIGAGTLATTGYTAPMAAYPSAAAAGSGTLGAAGGGSILSQALRDPQTYQRIGSAFSNAAEGQAGERDQENNYANSTNRAIADMYRTSQDAAFRALENTERGNLDRASLDLQQRNFALQAPSVRGRRGLSADLLANFQPATMQGLPSRISSRMPVINQSGLSQQGQLLARLLRDQAISETQRGDQFSPIPQQNFQGAIQPTPQLQGYRGPGAGESILGYLGMGANIYGALKGGR